MKQEFSIPKIVVQISGLVNLILVAFDLTLSLSGASHRASSLLTMFVYISFAVTIGLAVMRKRSAGIDN